MSAFDALNPKQQQFVREYLIDLNATKAAIRAGYSARTAAQQASRLLTDVKISAAIVEGRAQLAEKAGITAERVLQEYARIGFADIRDAVTWRSLKVGEQPFAADDESDRDEEAVAAREERQATERALHVTDIRFKDSDKLAPDVAAAISEVSVSAQGTVKVKFHDKKGALDSMARHLGMFVDRVAHEGGARPIKVEESFDRNSARRLAFALARAAGGGGQGRPGGD